MRRFALLLLGLAAPACAVDRFDLVCQGTRMTTRTGPAAPYAFKVHVDLAGSRWCMDACERTMEINRVDGDKVVLQDDLVDNTREEATRDMVFDRKNGTLHRLLITARPDESYQKVEATCTTQSFTPFPPPRAGADGAAPGS